MKPIKILTCKFCNKQFSSTNPYERFCPTCRQTYFWKYLAKGEVKHCAYCGVELTKKNCTAKHAVKYCDEHNSSMKRHIKTPTSCIVCGKLFYPTEARPDARICSRFCQGVYVQNQSGRGCKHNDDMLKEKIINYYKHNGYKNSNKVLHDLGLTHNTLTRRNILLSDLAKEAGISLVRCKYSIFEEEIYDCFRKNFQDIEIIRQKRFQNCKDKLPLPFDFYIPKFNLLIEADGVQHYNRNSKYRFFDNPSDHDFIKNNFCVKNKIYLLRIKYKRIIKEQTFCNILKNLFLQIERSEANYLNCWDGVCSDIETFQISSQDQTS